MCAISELSNRRYTHFITINLGLTGTNLFVTMFLDFSAGSKGTERIPGDQEDGVPEILLPQRRRTAGDSVADQKPESSSASPQEVLREYITSHFRGLYFRRSLTYL